MALDVQRAGAGILDNGQRGVGQQALQSRAGRELAVDAVGADAADLVDDIDERGVRLPAGVSVGMVGLAR